jgi:hypothetical protein
LIYFPSTEKPEMPGRPRTTLKKLVELMEAAERLEAAIYEACPRRCRDAARPPKADRAGRLWWAARRHASLLDDALDKLAGVLERRIAVKQQPPL